MSEQKTSQQKEQRFGKTIRSDLKQLKIKEDLGDEYKSLKEYYLTEERKKRLKTMGGCKRFFLIPWWLAKGLFFKLTPFRRILLIIGIVLLILGGKTGYESSSDSYTIDFSVLFSGLIFLFIIALELKDKLHAKTELEEGRAIQLALMPDRNPVVPGWDIWLYTRSANDVGGDLLDFIQLDKNKYAIAVGDVAGKGLSAALLMAKLQATIRALTLDYESLLKLGEKLNKIFYRDSLPKIFASLLYLELESNSSKVQFLNAGHFPPMVVSENRIQQLKKDAPALGLMPSATFHEQSIQIIKDDVIFIYSDGLTEAQNETGEFFSEEKLIEILRNNSSKTSEQIGEELILQVSNFVGKAPIFDDLTISILKRTD
ncbi:MAG: serine/threonine-protein phosphatase [Ignavibacteria bacterium]|nr:serine/threonine-protein phosphatase [Ignavibacteria bacterium]MBT8390768.1 serine/threonine-protein phosphatase [Ignavibacteria bacterium]